MNRTTPVTVAVTDETADGVDDAERWAEVAQSTLAAEGVERGHLDLIFVDADQMAELNVAHMGHSGPTDVLSFPLDAEDGGDDLFDAAVPRHLGDVVVCPSVAEAQAPEHCGTMEAEMTLLVVHGVLHVLGHDHGEPAEAAIMLERERVALASRQLTHPGPVQ